MDAALIPLYKSTTPPQEEVERIRRLLVYLLACDYQIGVPVELSTTDHTHFVKLNKYVARLQRTVEYGPATTEEREVLAPFFWRFIYSPCQALGLSSNILVGKLREFRVFASCMGNYMGSRHGVLHHHGFEALARKLWTDRYFVLEAAVPDSAMRARFDARIAKYQAMYFESISGYESYTKEMDMKGIDTKETDNPSITSRRFLSLMEGMRFQLNERGRAYQAAWEKGVCPTLPNRFSPEVAFSDARNWLKKYFLRVYESGFGKKLHIRRFDPGSPSGDMRFATCYPDLWEEWKGHTLSAF
ncbi:uncharacterized protein K452DRAFT_225548 [Aplosporella prunicola CBS 121167]|uniref:Uncharacterized protein n=1 Tax=Aplosporella prunicola CBS 121167 TaxID=1176127 RepID=A0A6A6BIS0_9PEZI|nr:uncharacterized protein K452DRAFT_225548 [Aplosporella prunicola CBS 121167]KAF2143174.1 hypothetical protein K452DRAFT_225548 [Aplosporella prunicola CBS 121167]